MKPRTLAVVKGILFSLIMAAVVLVSIWRGNGQITAIAFIIGILLVFGVEIREIEVGNWLYVDFESIKTGAQDDKDNDDD